MIISGEGDIEKLINKNQLRIAAIDISVDEKLIGGAIIKAEDNVIDDSVKGKLEKFAKNLN